MKTYSVTDMAGVVHVRKSERHYTHAVFARIDAKTREASLRGTYRRLRGIVDGQLQAGEMTRRWAAKDVDGITEDEYVAKHMPANLWGKPSFCGSLELAYRRLAQLKRSKHYALKTPTYDQFDIVEVTT